MQLQIHKAFQHFSTQPLFADKLVTWFINDCLDTELLPDFLIEILNSMKHMVCFSEYCHFSFLSAYIFYLYGLDEFFS